MKKISIVTSILFVILMFATTAVLAFPQYLNAYENVFGTTVSCGHIPI